MPTAMKERRSFKVVSTTHGKLGGRFVSKVPYGAARKAARDLFSTSPAMRGYMQIQEITRGSKGRVYSYAAIIESDARVVKFTNKLGKVQQIRRKYVVRVTKMTEIAFAALIDGAMPKTKIKTRVKTALALPPPSPGSSGDESGNSSSSEEEGEEEGEGESVSDMSEEEQLQQLPPVAHAAGGGYSTYY